jgi:hypothetical protein
VRSREGFDSESFQLPGLSSEALPGCLDKFPHANTKWAVLKSQISISRSGHSGRRYTGKSSTR